MISEFFYLAHFLLLIYLILAESILYILYFVSRCRAIFYGNAVNKPLLLLLLLLLLLIKPPSACSLSRGSNHSVSI